MSESVQEPIEVVTYAHVGVILLSPVPSCSVVISVHVVPPSIENLCSKPVPLAVPGLLKLNSVSSTPAAIVVPLAPPVSPVKK